MSEQSRFHFHIEWAKERLDEMDAILASPERQGLETQTASRAKADQLIADLRKSLMSSSKAMNTQFQAGETARLAAEQGPSWRTNGTASPPRRINIRGDGSASRGAIGGVP